MNSGKELLQILDTYRDGDNDNDDTSVTIVDPNDNVRIGKWLEAGTYTMRTVGVGRKTISFEVPDYNLVIASTRSMTDQLAIDELARREETQQEAAWLFGSREVVDESALAANESYAAWLDTINMPTRDEMIAAAAQIAHENRDNMTGRIACKSCDGAGEHGSNTCMCRELKSSITDRTGNTVYEDDTTDYDSDCDTCHGTGHSVRQCYSCNGVGMVDLYPELTITNPLTMQSYTFRFDVARMIATDPTLLTMTTNGYIYPYTGEIRASKRISFDETRAIALLAHVDRSQDETVHIKYGDSLQYLRSFDDFFSDGHTIEIREWGSEHGDMSSSRGRGDQSRTAVRSPSARELLTLYQQSLACGYNSNARQWGGLRYEVVYAATPERRLVDLRLALGARGLSIASMHEFIATGEAGPVIYAMRGETFIAPLAQDYTVERAVEPAWRRFLEIAHELPDYSDDSA